jgi:hypothetical protein
LKVFNFEQTFELAEVPPALPAHQTKDDNLFEQART